jgi:hypothetical protein
MKMWITEGTASRDYPAIGVKKDARTADYNIDSINAATSQMNATTSRINAQTAQANAAKKSGSTEDKPLFDGKDYYDVALKMKSEMVETEDPNGEWGSEKIKAPKYTDNDVIGFVYDSTLNEDDVSEILTLLGYTDKDVQRYLDTIIKKDSATSTDEMRKEQIYMNNMR